MTTPPPDPSNPDLLEGISTYLISLDIVRDPAVAGAKPPLWIEPKLGVPAPGSDEGISAVEVGNDLVVGIAKATGIPPNRYEGFLRNECVEFTVRARKASFAFSFEQEVRVALNDKRGWQMATVPVNESLLFRDLQPITRSNLGYTYTMEYIFNLWAPLANAGP